MGGCEHGILPGVHGTGVFTRGQTQVLTTCTLGTLREKNTKCASCAYFELCNGGCRAVALALTGDKLGVDPSKCLFWELGYHKKIEALLPQYHTVYTGL